MATGDATSSGRRWRCSCSGRAIRSLASMTSTTRTMYGSRSGACDTSSRTLPYREDRDTDQTVSPPSADKKGAEVFYNVYDHFHGLDVTVFAYFTVYGPTGRPDMSPHRFIRWIFAGRPLTPYGDGSRSRDFESLDDSARGTIEEPRPPGLEKGNPGSDKPVVVSDEIRPVESLVGQPDRIVFRPRHPAEATATRADVRRAGGLLGREAREAFGEGMVGHVSSSLDNRTWTREISTRA